MTEFLLSDANFFFSVSVAVVIVFFVLEFAGLLFGIHIMAMLDDLPLFGADADSDIDMAPASIAGITSWLSLDKLPLMVWFVLFLSAFGLSGFLLNYLYGHYIGGDLVPLYISLPVAAIAGLLVAGRVGGAIAHLLPKTDTSALLHESFVGSVAEITMGVARSGSPAEAKFTDKYYQAHYVLVEPFEAEDQFIQGDRIILVKKGLRGWLATRYK